MMYNDRHLFVALPKCGSSFAQAILEKHGWKYPSHAPFGSWHHRPLCLTPEHLRVGRTTVGIIRNPWAWYRSFYYAEHKTQLARWEPGKHTDFQSWLKLVLDGREHPHLRMHHKLDVDLFTLMARWGCGILTVNYILLYSEDPGRFIRRQAHPKAMQIRVTRFLKNETLASDLEQLLGLPKAGLAAEPRVNVATHGHYSEDYTPVLAELVAKRDKLILEHFGYEYEEQAP